MCRRAWNVALTLALVRQAWLTLSGVSIRPGMKTLAHHRVATHAANHSLTEAKKRLQAAWAHDRENRDKALKDLRFLALDQWPQSVLDQREMESRPCLTLDHLNQFKNQVVNDIRQAKIALRAVGVDNKSDPDLAELMTGLMRDVQYQSGASHVYAEAANGQVSCGIGHFRFLTAYADDQVFDQELKIECIPYPYRFTGIRRRTNQTARTLNGASLLSSFQKERSSRGFLMPECLTLTLHGIRTVASSTGRPGMACWLRSIGRRFPRSGAWLRLRMAPVLSSHPMRTFPHWKPCTVPFVVNVKLSVIGSSTTY